jgi:hypothetical protein
VGLFGWPPFLTKILGLAMREELSYVFDANCMPG